MLRHSVPSLGVIAAVLMATSAAQAGGVIIDGRAPGAPAPGTTTTATNPPTGADDPGDTNTGPAAQLTTTEQQVYLFAALILNGHDAATAPGAPPITASQIIDELDADDAMGGCAQTPTSALAVLAGLLVFLRRRA